MHVPEFPDYTSAEILFVADGKFAVGMEFISREAVIKAIKEYTIRRSVDYRVYRSEPLIFYAKCDDLVTDIRVLHRVFWSYYPCIRAFRHCKPVVQVDGTHLYGKYKGCLLVAVSQDGNNNIVPIAFAIVEGETSDALYFFLSNLRQHVVTRDGVGLISDRHESINAAVERSNGYSRTVREYEVRYQRLRERGEAYTNWLNRIPREQYALAFDGGYRWGHMTTNLVECINSVLKGARNLPVTALVKATFYRLNELFTRKRAEAEARINAGHVFSEVVTSKLHANQLAAGNI
nr:uncharacterized protein LOC112772654 [Arachis hypogaea]